MSAEGKKKRGISGMTNAKNIPFRYHGYPKSYTLSTALGRSDHPRMAGAKLLHTLEWARLVPGFQASDRMLRAVDATIDHILSRHPDTATAREWREVA